MPVPMLGQLSPRAAAASPAGRDKVAAWLKRLENDGVRSPDPGDPMRTFDHGWIWRELTIGSLSRW